MESSPDSAELVYQAALDCFVSSLPSQNRRLALAHDIAVKLNMPLDKVFVLIVINLHTRSVRRDS